MSFSVILMALLFASSCGSTPTPSVTQTAYLDVYPEHDKCSIAPPRINGDGNITYESWMQGGFSGTLNITGLESNHTYIFTINGQDNYPGNKELKSSCKSLGNGEGYCDIEVRSDNQGAINQLITKKLDSGEYEPKIFIKDKAQGYCVLLYSNTPDSFEIK